MAPEKILKYKKARIFLSIVEIRAFLFVWIAIIFSADKFFCGNIVISQLCQFHRERISLT